MHLGGVARSAGGAERSSRGREGETFLIYTGPEGKPGGESRFPLFLKTDGVLKIQSYPKKKEKVRGFLPALHSVKGALGVRTYFTVLAHLDRDI